MGGLLDVFEKEPGVYLTEADGVPAPPKGVPKSLCGMFGVTKWGPLGATLVSSFGEWKFYFGQYISSVYPAYKQVKKYFQNGGTALYFSRIVNYSDPSDPSTIEAVKASGNLFDGTPVAASIGVAAAGGSNSGDEGAGLSAGTYTGSTNGVYKIKVTTAGAYGVGEVTITYTPENGSEVTVGTETPADGVAFAVENGVTFALTDGSDALLTLNDEWTIAVVASGKAVGDQRIGVEAKYVGALGNSVVVKTSTPNNAVAGDFNLSVWVDGVQKEFYNDLSPDVNSARYYETVVNSGSQYIQLSDILTNIQDIGIDQEVSLYNGADGISSLSMDSYKGDSEGRTGMRAFGSIDYPMTISCPDADVFSSDTDRNTIYSDMISYCDNSKPLFFSVLCIPQDKTDYASINAFQITTLAEDTTRAAMYYGFLKDEDDGQFIAPCGAIMGIYAKYSDDINKGVWWSPAGDQAGIKGFTAIEAPLTSLAIGKVTENRVNAIKELPGFGIVIWGSRTMTISQAAEFKYIGQRRNTADLESRMMLNSFYAVHKPNTPGLWAKVTNTFRTILHARYAEGGLSDIGGEPYVVKCDDTTNTLEAQQKGLLVAKVGIRNFYTTEYVWIDVTQLTAGATIE